MLTLNELIEKGPCLCVGNGAPEDRIDEAERQLGLRFSEEDRSYLQRFAVAALNGHELTGITDVARCNVVAVTEAEREHAPAAKGSWYVVEQADIDGIVLWQDADGFVYQTIEGGRPILFSKSLAEYVMK